MKNSRFKGRDQEIAVARYHSEAVDKTGPIQRKHVIWALTDYKVYVQGRSIPDLGDVALLTPQQP